MRKAILVPVKDPIRGKTRLSGLLSPEERRQIASSMFEDVARAIAGAGAADLVAVVTGYEPASLRAAQWGFDVLFEESQESESQSVDWASRELAARGIDSVLRIPADIPLIRSGDVDLLLGCELDPPAALIVPSRDLSGTNAILRTPPDLFPSRFGPNSLALHWNEATQAGALCAVVENPRIGLDIDDPEDLRLFLDVGEATGTFATLMEMQMKRRLKAFLNQAR